MTRKSDASSDVTDFVVRQAQPTPRTRKSVHVGTAIDVETFNYTPFTRSSKHQANVDPMYSKYTC